MSERHMLDIVHDQKPLTLPPTATVREACKRMAERRVGAVLVTADDDHLVGIFTGRDAVCRVLAEGKSAARTHLSDVMTPDPHCMPPAIRVSGSIQGNQPRCSRPTSSMSRHYLRRP